MFLTSWLRKLKPISHQARRTVAPTLGRGFRPRVEVLEDRAVPAMLTVTTPLDVVDPNDGLFSLREAVLQANASPGADIINLPAGSYALTLAGAGEDFAASGDLDITGHLTIQGAGAGATIIDAAGMDRAFQVCSAKVSIAGVTIQGGVADFGGGIYASDSNLTIDHCRLSGNSAGYHGGGISVAGGALTVEHSTISDNNSAELGGGIFGSGTIVTVTHSTISDNTATLVGGGIVADGGGYGTLSIDQSTISGNSAGYFGGGIYAFGASVTIDHSMISGNSANLGGGGIIVGVGTLAIDQSTISGNSAYQGGGIYAYAATDLTIDQSTISDNSAEQGGGLYAGEVTVEIENSTLNNSVGGGIVNDNSTIHMKKTVVDGVFYLDQDYA